MNRPYTVDMASWIFTKLNQVSDEKYRAIIPSIPPSLNKDTINFIKVITIRNVIPNLITSLIKGLFLYGFIVLVFHYYGVDHDRVAS
jgi:hypothetical protein